MLQLQWYLMLREVLIFNLILCPWVLSKRRHHKKKDSAEELGGELITSLRNDANLDLSMDEEYEDLRAELLAYHTALSSLAGARAEDVPGALPREVIEAVAAEPGNNVAPGDTADTRRSMKTTPCWKLGGICVNHKMCVGHRFLTEIPGCKNKLEVCCFTWNKFETRDLADKGISNLALPWSTGHFEFGGKGPVRPDDGKLAENARQRGSRQENSDIVAYDLSSIELPKKKIKKVPKMQKNLKKYQTSKKQKPALVVVLKPDKK